jgi:hypothetical protein
MLAAVDQDREGLPGVVGWSAADCGSPFGMTDSPHPLLGRRAGEGLLVIMAMNRSRRTARLAWRTVLNQPLDPCRSRFCSDQHAASTIKPSSRGTATLDVRFPPD